MPPKSKMPPDPIQGQYILCKRMKIPSLTYSDSMKAALLSGSKSFHRFSNMSPILVNVFVTSIQLGTCCVYFIFVGINLKELIEGSQSKKLSIVVYMLMILAPFILISLVPNLKWLAPFSLFSNLLTFICFGLVLYYIFQGLPSIEERPWAGAIYNFPLFFGTTLFALEVVGVVITVENNMKTPKSFGGYFGVLNISMTFITLLYLSLGFLGYWKYGEETASSVTLNLPEEDVVSKVVQGLYSVAIYISFGLQNFVLCDILWNTYIALCCSNSKCPRLWEYMFRILTVLISFVLALSIPLLGLFISFVGSFSMAALGILFPAIMDICVNWPDNLGFAKWVVLKDVGIIVVRLVGLLSGSYSSVYNIVKSLSSGDY